jgi:hypothetical protein
MGTSLSAAGATAPPTLVIPVKNALMQTLAHVGRIMLGVEIDGDSKRRRCVYSNRETPRGE